MGEIRMYSACSTAQRTMKRHALYQEIQRVLIAVAIVFMGIRLIEVIEKIVKGYR